MPEVCLQCIGFLIMRKQLLYSANRNEFDYIGFAQLCNMATSSSATMWQSWIGFFLWCFLAVEVLKDLCSVQPGPEASEAFVSDLFPSLVCDHLAILLYYHQFGHCCDLVALP